MADEKALEDRFQSVDLAYEFVIPSYQMLVSRFEAADGRLTALLTMMSTVTFAAPVLGRSINSALPFDSRWFAAAIAVFGFGLVIGLLARITGRLTLPNPMIIYNKNLRDSHWKFRKDAVFFAGRHFEKNHKAVDFKGFCADGLTVLLIVQLALFAIWIILLTPATVSG